MLSGTVASRAPNAQAVSELEIKGAAGPKSRRSGRNALKSEGRNPKPEGSPKSEFPKKTRSGESRGQVIRPSAFGFLSGFGFRVSDWPPALPPADQRRPSPRLQRRKDLSPRLFRRGEVRAAMLALGAIHHPQLLAVGGGFARGPFLHAQIGR